MKHGLGVRKVALLAGWGGLYLVAVGLNGRKCEDIGNWAGERMNKFVAGYTDGHPGKRKADKQALKELISKCRM